ncbi:MAG: methionyl-tRNA formyltransferase [Proteobacteria bacterium]|nr:methionyl-tRNA formyltransferase [Pseudomonadota bacterium]
MGTPDFAVQTLEAIVEAGHEVVAVVTQPDRAKGRGRSVVQTPVKVAALAEGIEVLQPTKVKDPAFIAQLKELAPDYSVVIAYGRILPASVLDIAGKGSINVHASLLPRHRGAAPINYAITSGDTVTGVTTMLMDTGMDTGAMLLKSETSIGEDETAGELFTRLSALGAQLLVETLEGMEAGKIEPVAQDDTLATYAPTLKKSDGKIKWIMSAEEIANLVRGFSPWPGTFTEYKGKLLKIHSGRVAAIPELAPGTADGSIEPGTILSVSPDAVVVKCGRGVYEVTELQPQDKRRMAARDFAAGYRVAPGERFG